MNVKELHHTKRKPLHFSSPCRMEVVAVYFANSIDKGIKIPGLYRLMPRIFRSIMQKSFGENAGFKATYYDCPNNEFRADMTVCPYLEMCRKYGCPEFVPAFCETNDVAYGNMHPNIIWGRTKTLGKGGDCCDFKLTVGRKGKT